MWKRRPEGSKPGDKSYEEQLKERMEEQFQEGKREKEESSEETEAKEEVKEEVKSENEEQETGKSIKKPGKITIKLTAKQKKEEAKLSMDEIEELRKKREKYKGKFFVHFRFLCNAELRTRTFYAAIFFVKSQHSISHCLGMNYYVNFLGGIGSNVCQMNVRYPG